MPPKKQGWTRLFVASLLLAALWLVALPRIGSLTPIRRHIETMRSHHVDPSAMFYTDLDDRFWRSRPGISRSER